MVAATGAQAIRVVARSCANKRELFCRRIKDTFLQCGSRRAS